MVLFPESSEVASLCSRVACKNDHPSLEKLVQMREKETDMEAACSKNLFGREEIDRCSGGLITASLLRYSKTWL